MSDKPHSHQAAAKKPDAEDQPIPGDSVHDLRAEAQMAKGKLPVGALPPVPAPVVVQQPRREPLGEGMWRVTVRHSPLKIKTLVVQAGSKEEAWQKFLAKATAETTEAEYKTEPGRHKLAREMLAEAHKNMPEGTEIIGDDYARKRLKVMLAKGTVTIDQVEGLEELASAAVPEDKPKKAHA